MTVGRFLFGYHPNFGEFGAWLSKPGYEVLTPGDQSNFLLFPRRKHEQIIMSGVVAVASGTSVNIPYPLGLTKKPYATLHFSQTPNVQYPGDLSLAGTGAQPELFAGMTLYYNQITFSNSTIYALWIHYLIFYRGITT